MTLVFLGLGYLARHTVSQLYPLTGSFHNFILLYRRMKFHCVIGTVHARLISTFFFFADTISHFISQISFTGMNVLHFVSFLLVKTSILEISTFFFEELPHYSNCTTLHFPNSAPGFLGPCILTIICCLVFLALAILTVGR